MGWAPLFAWIYRRYDGRSTGERLLLTVVLGIVAVVAVALVAVSLQHIFGWHTPGPG